MGKDKSVLIILDYSDKKGMKPTTEEIQEAKKTSPHKNLIDDSDSWSQKILLGTEAVRACQRLNPPLLWFNSQFNHVNDSKEDVKEWIKGRNKDFCSRDLITDLLYVAGYGLLFRVK